MTPRARKQVQDAFDAMDFIDLDWSSPKTWKRLIELSLRARKEEAPIPGIVDRMILACSLEAGPPLWTLDRKLQGLSRALAQPLFHAE